MSSFASLPPPSFGPAAAALRGADGAPREAFGAPALDSGAPLHVGAEGAGRPIEDLERAFLAALCENPDA